MLCKPPIYFDGISLLQHCRILKKKNIRPYFLTSPRSIVSIISFHQFNSLSISMDSKRASIRECYNHRCIPKRANWTKRGMSFQWMMNECNTHCSYEINSSFCPLLLSGFQLVLLLSAAILALHASNKRKIVKYCPNISCLGTPSSRIIRIHHYLNMYGFFISFFEKKCHPNTSRCYRNSRT